MKTAACSGGAGDLVYSIPVLRALGVSRIYVKENFYRQPHGNLHQTMKRLIESQGIECLPTSGAFYVGQFDPELQFDYNIDNFRQEPNRGTVHIMINMAKHFKVMLNNKWNRPWLHGIPETTDPQIRRPYTLIHLTERWREGSHVDWKKINHSLTGHKYFIGLQHEWLHFCQNYGDIPWMPTDDIYDMAQIITGCQALYCNQSVALTLAQGIGKNYWLDRKYRKSNTLIYTKNEHLL